MIKVTPNISVEYGTFCANSGVLVTSQGVVMIESPMFPQNARKMRDEIAKIGELKYLINTEPHPDHVAGNYYFKTTQVGHEGFSKKIAEISLNQIKDMLSRSAPGTILEKDYALPLPVITFSERLTLMLGNHTIELLHLPGHTSCETAVFIPQEKVVFTGDNVVRGTMPFFFEADPFQWLESLKQISQLDVDFVVPGHGTVDDKSCLQNMSAEINAWLDAVKSAIDRGWDLAETQSRINLLERYQIDKSRLEMTGNVQKKNIAHLYQIIKSSK